MKRIICLVISAIMLCSVMALPFSANAADTASASMGFSVDTDEYKNVSWRERKKTYIYANNVLVGSTFVDVGTTTAKQKVYYNGSYWYLDAVLTRVTYQGNGGGNFWKGYYYGYINDDTVEVNVGSNNILWAYSPTQVASNISYSVGGSASAGFSKTGPSVSLGITGSQSFKKDALTIKDKTSFGSNTCKLIFDYDNWVLFRWNWDFLEYSYNTSSQIMVTYALSKTPKYEVNVKNSVKYNLADAEPSYWMTWYSGDYSFSNSWKVSVCH